MEGPYVATGHIAMFCRGSGVQDHQQFRIYIGFKSASPTVGDTSAFIEDCPTVVCIDGVSLTGLLDTGSQVTLMQHSLLNQHFSDHQIGVRKTSSVLTLKAVMDLMTSKYLTEG